MLWDCLPGRGLPFLCLSYEFETQTLLCRETQTSVNQQGKKQPLNRVLCRVLSVLSWEKERRNLYRNIGSVANLLKGIQKSNSCDQTYRSMYSVQIGWEFQLPCDLLPWLSLRKKHKEIILQWINVTVSTLISKNIYRNIWGNWITFKQIWNFLILCLSCTCRKFWWTQNLIIFPKHHVNNTTIALCLRFILFCDWWEGNK